MLISALFRRVDWFLAVGTRNTDYYRYLGVPPARILSFPYSVDNRRFAAAGRPGGARRVVALYAAKLIPRKDPWTFIQAAQLLQERGVPVIMRMAGSGPLERELVERAKELKLGNLEFCGFVNQAAMPDQLRDADIFVATPNWEPWGLVINEAMAAGLAIITSEEAGCAVDLVHEGINGFRIRSSDAATLADRVERLVEQPEMLACFQRESGRIIHAYSLERSVEHFVAAMQAVRNSRGRTGP